MTRGVSELFLGRYEQAKSDMLLGMRLSPRDPLTGLFHFFFGNAELGLGHIDAAIDEYHKTLDAGSAAGSQGLAAAYALEGKMEEAKSALAEARRANPKLTVKWLVSIGTHANGRMIEGLRKAGLPGE
jgi:adenylate cyclase